MSIKTQTSQSFVSQQYEATVKNKALSKSHIQSDMVNSMEKDKNNNENGDSLTISSEEMEKLQNEEEEKSLLEQYQAQAESGKASAKAFEDMAKMMEIARRIANGDKVPAKDEQKLMEFNSDLYQAAKSASVMNEDKEYKKYKTMFEEEETQNSDKSADETTEAETEEAAMIEQAEEGSPETETE